MTSTQARVAVVVAAVGFGALAFFAKLALRAGVDPMVFLLGRFVTAAATLALVGRWQRSRQNAGFGDGTALGLGFVIYAGQALCLTFALERAPLSFVAVLFGTYPVYVLALLLLVGRQHLMPALVVPLFGVLAGSTLVLSPGTVAIDAVGIALALGAAALFAAFVVSSNALVAHAPAITVATRCCVGAAMSLLVATSATSRLGFDFDAAGWIWIVAAGVISTGIAFVALFRSLPLVGPAVAGVVLGAEPVVTVGLALIFLGDHLSATQAGGALLAVVSIMLIQRQTEITPPTTPA